MPERQILFFNGARLVAMHWHNGQIATEGAFAADPVGLEAFGSYLATHRRSLFYLLVDIGDEGFQLESIPFVQGSDRASLITRRLGQYFYATPYSVGISLGREKEGRRDERMLFAALTRPESFAPWLEALDEAKAVLVGIYSVPLLLVEHAAALLGGRTRCLLVTHSSGGLRQTYFEDGSVQFSRLSPLGETSVEGLAAACQTELAKTYQYLLGQRRIRRGMALSALILSPARMHGSLRERLADDEEIRYEFAEQSLLAGKKAAAQGEFHADMPLAAALLARTPKRQFAPAHECHRYRVWRYRFGLHASAVAILLGCLLIAARLGLEWHEVRQKITAMHGITSTSNARYEAILDGLPKVNVTPENLRSVISGFGQLERRSQAYEPLLRHLGAVLEREPRIELVRLEWELTSDFTAKLGAGEAPLAKLNLALPGAGRGQAAPAGGATTWYVVDVEGQLPPAMAADQRALVDLVERFAASLVTDEIRVSLTKRPVDVESAKSLKSRLESLLTAESAPRFQLRLGREIKG